MTNTSQPDLVRRLRLAIDTYANNTAATVSLLQEIESVLCVRQSWRREILAYIEQYAREYLCVSTTSLGACPDYRRVNALYGHIRNLVSEACPREEIEEFVMPRIPWTYNDLPKTNVEARIKHALGILAEGS